MGTLGYTATMSLDGYVADVDGDIQWGAPSEEVFGFHVERMASVSTEVLGRKTYELMQYWEAEPAGETWGEAEHEFARRWQGLNVVVASSTLQQADLGRGEPELVPRLTLTELERIVAEAPGEVEIFGPTTASEAIRAGMVEQFRLFVVPTTLGAGLPALPSDAHLLLRLVDQRVFANGTVFLHYRAE